MTKSGDAKFQMHRYQAEKIGSLAGGGKECQMLTDTKLYRPFLVVRMQCWYFKTL
jgi:hypothetical protein